MCKDFVFHERIKKILSRRGGGGCTDNEKQPSKGRSVPEFLRKPIATCDFPGGPDPLSLPSGSAHVFGPVFFVKSFGTF